jgi:CBS domain-containing protein
MNIGALIRKPLEVLSPSGTCQHAALIMRDRHVGSVVVVERGRPLGIVTDRDLVTRVMALGDSPEHLLVREIMTAFPIYLSATSSTEDAVRTMREMAVRRLPVVDDEGELVGMIALEDLVIHLGKQLHALGLAIDDAVGVSPFVQEAHVS